MASERNVWSFGALQRAVCYGGLLIGLVGIIIGQAGRFWIYLDVFSQFSIHFFFLILCCFIALRIKPVRLHIALILYLAALVIYGVWARWGQPEQLNSIASGMKSLRVATFNVHDSNRDFLALQEEIIRLNADAIVLVESNRYAKGQLPRLASLYPYSAVCRPLKECRLEILSKFPFKTTKSYFNWEGPPAVEIQYGPELKNLRIVGVHTSRFPYVNAQLRQIILFAGSLEKTIREYPSTPLIVLGDFNATGFSEIIRTFTMRTGLRRLTYLPSWPTWSIVPQLGIDHIFISPNIKPLGTAVLGNAAGSDHFPVVTIVAVPVR